LNEKFNYYKHRISYLTGTCYNFEMEEFSSSFCIARVCQHQLGFLVYNRLTVAKKTAVNQITVTLAPRFYAADNRSC